FSPGGPLTTTDTVDITIDAVKDPPVNTVPGPQGTNEDTNLVFSPGGGNGIVINDPDANEGTGLVQITLGVTHGTLTLSRLTGLSFSAGDGTSDGTMTFTGTLVDINAALDGLTFSPDLNYNGGALLTVTTDDLGNTGIGGSLTDTDSVAITINAVNDAPVITLPVGPQATNEDTTLVLSSSNGNAISIADVDVAGGLM